MLRVTLRFENRLPKSVSKSVWFSWHVSCGNRILSCSHQSQVFLLSAKSYKSDSLLTLRKKQDLRLIFKRLWRGWVNQIGQGPKKMQVIVRSVHLLFNFATKAWLAWKFCCLWFLQNSMIFLSAVIPHFSVFTQEVARPARSQRWYFCQWQKSQRHPRPFRWRDQS